jgi:hypothetical protein
MPRRLCITWSVRSLLNHWWSTKLPAQMTNKPLLPHVQSDSRASRFSLKAKSEMVNSRSPTSLVLLHTTYTCAFKPGCLMSHNWLHTPDCKVLNE